MGAVSVACEAEEFPQPRTGGTHLLATISNPEKTGDSPAKAASKTPCAKADSSPKGISKHAWCPEITVPTHTLTRFPLTAMRRVFSSNAANTPCAPTPHIKRCRGARHHHSNLVLAVWSISAEGGGGGGAAGSKGDSEIPLPSFSISPVSWTEYSVFHRGDTPRPTVRPSSTSLIRLSVRRSSSIQFAGSQSGQQSCLISSTKKPFFVSPWCKSGLSILLVARSLRIDNKRLDNLTSSPISRSWLNPSISTIRSDSNCKGPRT